MFEKKKDTKDEKDKSREKKPEPKKKVLPEVPKVVTTEMEEIMRRLRLLEERYSSIRKKSELIEHNMLRDSKEITDELTVLNSTIGEFRKDLQDVTEKLTKLAEEVRGSVKKSDFRVLAKYLEYWDPMTFLTKDQAEKMIQEHMQKG